MVFESILSLRVLRMRALLRALVCKGLKTTQA